MNEDLHIEKAAQLADKPAAENLATDRARDFVAKALDSRKKEEPSRKNIFVLRPVYAWGGMALAVAACVVVAVVLFRPSAQEGVIPGYGTPGTLLENQSIHANTEQLDSTLTENSDTLQIETIILPEE